MILIELVHFVRVMKEERYDPKRPARLDAITVQSELATERMHKGLDTDAGERSQNH